MANVRQNFTFCLFSCVVLLEFVAARRCKDGTFCPIECCRNSNGQTYCCQMEGHDRNVNIMPASVTFGSSVGLLLAGLIASVLVSVILSLICCLFCNGCWLRRRLYSGQFGGLGGSLGFPMGTLVLSSHPPHIHETEAVYGDSTLSSTSSSRQNRVRFNEDGQPSSILKNKNRTDQFV